MIKLVHKTVFACCDGRVGKVHTIWCRLEGVFVPDLKDKKKNTDGARILEGVFVPVLRVK